MDLLKKLILFFIILIGFNQLVFAGEFGNQACYDNCESGAYDDDLGELCVAIYDDDLGLECLDTYASDYEDDCMDEFNDEDFGGEILHFDSGQDCVEEFDGYYDTICLEDHETEVREDCLSNHYEEMMDECVDMPFVEYGADGCCPNEDDLWSEELGGCIGEEVVSCIEDGGCNLDGDPWGTSCDGKLGSNVNGASASCITEEEYDCLDGSMIWLDGECYEDGNIEQFICEEENGFFWSESLSQCFEDEDAKICAEADGYYSFDLENCFYNYDKMICEEDGLNYFEGNCLDDDTFQCAENDEFFCSDSSSCVADEDACCEDEDLYVEMNGVCADSVEEAECLNAGDEWNEDYEVCNYEEPTGNQGSSSRSNSNQDSYSTESVFNSEAPAYGDDHNYISPEVTNNGKYKLSKISNTKLKMSGNINSNPTAVKFSPDGESFIVGIYNSAGDDRRISYDILSYNANVESSFGNFNIIKQNAFFQHDFANELLLDWNPESHYIYFLSKGTNDEHRDFKIKSYYTGLENNVFESKRISDLRTVFSSEFQAINTYVYPNKIDLFDSFFNPLKTTVNNVYEFNPSDSTEVIVGTKKSSSDMYSPMDTSFRTLKLEHGQNYNEIKTFRFGVERPQRKMPNTEYYKYSKNGKFIISYTENSFKIIDSDKFFNSASDDSISYLNEEYILERIIPDHLKTSQKMTDFSFDTKYMDNGLPKGIFYSIYDENSENSKLNYVSLETGKYFKLDTISYYIDSIEVNPVKDELLVHSCYYSNPDKLSEFYMGETMDKRFLECELTDLQFERKQEKDNHLFFKSNILNYTTSYSLGFSNYYFEKNIFTPKIIFNENDKITSNDIKLSIDKIKNSNDLLDLVLDFDSLKSDLTKVNLSSKKTRELINFNIRKNYLTKKNLILSCNDLKDADKVSSKISNKDLLILNIYNLANNGCEYALNYYFVEDYDCKYLKKITDEVIKGDFKRENYTGFSLVSKPFKKNPKYSKIDNVLVNPNLDLKLFIPKENLIDVYKEMVKKCSKKTLFDFAKNTKKNLKKKDNEFIFLNGKMLKLDPRVKAFRVEKPELVKKGKTILIGGKLFNIDPRIDLDDNVKKIGRFKIQTFGFNPNPQLSPYGMFLNLLKKNYIININGIRNDSTIQYMSINLKEGNVIEEEDSNAFLLFEINQETLEEIFSDGGNLGELFFEKVVSGEIKLSKLDNRGIFESMGDWLSSLFSDDEGEAEDEEVSCPEIVSEVCGVNGETYANGCFANEAGVEIASNGACIVQGACIHPKISYVNESGGIYPVECLNNMTEYKCNLLQGDNFEVNSLCDDLTFDHYGSCEYINDNNENTCSNILVKSACDNLGGTFRVDKRCVVAVCGDGIDDRSEECDDGNLVDGDSCNSDCTLPSAKGACIHPKISWVNENGVFPVDCLDNQTEYKCNLLQGDNFEVNSLCDNLNFEHYGSCEYINDDNENTCSNILLKSACDNLDGTFIVDNRCVVAVCGNGIVDLGEECDDGNLVDGDSCNSNCTLPPAKGACIYPKISWTNENGVFPVDCLDNQTEYKCNLLQGDNFVVNSLCDNLNFDHYGSCEYINENNEVTCINGLLNSNCDNLEGRWTESGRCVPVVCGDGIVNLNEECDDGNLFDGDSCNSDCTLPPVQGACIHPKISYVNESGIYPVECLDNLTEYKCNLLQGVSFNEGEICKSRIGEIN